MTVAGSAPASRTRNNSPPETISNPAPASCQQLQNREVAVRFHRIADLVRRIAEGFVISLKAVQNAGARIYVAGRAFAPRDIGKRNIFQVKRLIAVLHLADFQHDQGLIIVHRSAR